MDPAWLVAVAAFVTAAGSFWYNWHQNKSRVKSDEFQRWIKEVEYLRTTLAETRKELAEARAELDRAKAQIKELEIENLILRAKLVQYSAGLVAGSGEEPSERG